MLIQILPDEVASQIAAGEVVERPASVVKELLENALDAEASQVTVRVEGAGRKLIEVSDNGHGIAADQISLALARHATSKLRSAEDLFHIQTLGFRGEALASIGSVSRLTLISRSRGEEVGARLLVEGGHMGGLDPLGAPAGTVVRVEDLFYNVPARLKFLKQDSTERQQIDALVPLLAGGDIGLPCLERHIGCGGLSADVHALLIEIERDPRRVTVAQRQTGLGFGG